MEIIKTDFCKRAGYESPEMQIVEVAAEGAIATSFPGTEAPNVTFENDEWDY